MVFFSLRANLLFSRKMSSENISFMLDQNTDTSAFANVTNCIQINA